jgi:hypothetical protein
MYKTFKQYLQEALDKPYRFRKQDSLDTSTQQQHWYSFKDRNKNKTHVYISHHVTTEPSRASVDFTDENGDFEATGKGSIRHLSTVKKIMQDHAKKHPHLKSYTFTSHKDVNREDKGGRQKLYKRLVRMAGGKSTDNIHGDETKHMIPINRDKNGD